MPFSLGFWAAAGAGAGGGLTSFFGYAGYSISNLSFYGDLDETGYSFGGRDTSDSTYRFGRLNADLSIAWQRSLTITNGFRGTGLIRSDSSKNVYAIGYTTNDGTGNAQDFYAAKYNSSGTLQWQRKLGDSNNQEFYDGDATSNGDVIFAGDTGNYPSNYRFLAVLDNAGNTTWQRLINDSGRNYSGCAFDSSSNFYGFSLDSSYYNSIVKYNSAGTLQWKKTVYPASGQQSGYTGGAIDSSGNVYAVGRSSANYTNAGVIVKVDSAGNFSWCREITQDFTQFSKAAVDSSGNVYVTLSNGVIKINSSGSIVWQRSISNFTVMDIQVIGDYMYLSGANSRFAKLKTDGSGTGSYVVSGVTHTYAASSYSLGSFTRDVIDTPGSSNTTFLTNAASSATSATITSYSITYTGV